MYPALEQCRGGRRFAVLARAVAYLDADAEVSEPVTADVMRIMGEQLLVDVPFRDSFDEPVRAGLVPVCFFLLVGNGRMRILDRNGFEGYEMLGAEVFLYFDYEGSSMTARVDPRTTARTGDHVKFALDAEKIHVFDKETQVTITN